MQDIIKELIENPDYKENLKEILGLYFKQNPDMFQEWKQWFEPVKKDDEEITAFFNTLVKEKDTKLEQEARRAALIKNRYAKGVVEIKQVFEKVTQLLPEITIKQDEETEHCIHVYVGGLFDDGVWRCAKVIDRVRYYGSSYGIQFEIYQNTSNEDRTIYSARAHINTYSNDFRVGERKYGTANEILKFVIENCVKEMKLKQL
jgi:dTDP-glucose pyrophosphorylase